ncbi:MAG: C45 family peptidase [Acidimicrobiales bacterium]
MQRRRLDARRMRELPEYSARTRAFGPMGVPDEKASAVFVMDVLQNAIGLLGRTGMFDHHQFAAAPSCSSVAVWGGATVEGELRHARNFDFPGASIWDLAPAVVFCEPVDGLRYGFVTTRGLDAPGITCFNEAGITLTVHTRFHRDVNYRGTSVIDLGHEVIRTSRTLDDAIATVRRLGACSTWGLLISSATERDAVVVETTGATVEVVRSGDASHLSCTNRYLTPTLQAREVTTSTAFAIDSDSRWAQLEEFVAKCSGGIDGDALEELLGDYSAPGVVDRTDGVTRLSGNSVVSPISVASIVAEPERSMIRVSVGRAPSGFGPYLQVPWSWDGPVGRVDDEYEVGPTRGRSHRGELLTDVERDVAHRLSRVTQRFVDRAEPHEVRAEFEDLCHRAPNEPGFHAMAAFLAIIDDQMTTALDHIDAALALESTPHPRARMLLYRSRVLEVLGRSSEAAESRSELAAMTDPLTAHERTAAAKEATKPMSRRMLRLITPDLFNLDAHH